MPRRRAVELVDEGVLGAAQHGERRDAAEVVGVLGAAVRTVEDRRRGGPLRRPVAESGLRIDRVHGPSVYGTSPPASSAGRSGRRCVPDRCRSRSEEHTSELQSLMRISYAVFCLKKKKKPTKYNEHE